MRLVVLAVGIIFEVDPSHRLAGGAAGGLHDAVMRSQPERIVVMRSLLRVAVLTLLLVGLLQPAARADHVVQEDIWYMGAHSASVHNADCNPDGWVSSTDSPAVAISAAPTTFQIAGVLWSLVYYPGDFVVCGQISTSDGCLSIDLRNGRGILQLRDGRGTYELRDFEATVRLSTAGRRAGSLTAVVVDSHGRQSHWTGPLVTQGIYECWQATFFNVLMPFVLQTRPL